MTTSKQLFRLAGGFSFAVAIFQAVISFVPSWSQYFGAPEELEANAAVLIMAGLAAAIIFGVFGLYALAGAGDIRTLPLLRAGIAGIGGVYILRGLLLIPQLLILARVLQSSETITPQGVIASLVSLFIGLLYWTGTVIGWRGLQIVTRP